MKSLRPASCWKTVSPESYYGYTTFPCVCNFPMQRMNYLSNLTLHLQFMHCSLERDLMHLKQVNLPWHLFTSTCTSVTSTYTSVFECSVKLLYMYCYSNCNFNSMLYFIIFCSFFKLFDINFRFSFLSTHQLLHFRQKKVSTSLTRVLCRTLVSLLSPTFAECIGVHQRVSEEEYREKNKWMRE